MSPLSNEPSLAVTVWGARPVWCQVTLAPPWTDIEAGSYPKSTMLTSPGGAGAAAGVGVRTGVAAGAGAFPDASVTTRVPVMLGWKVQVYVNVPGVVKWKLHD